jgi:hypothetical protein
MSRRKPSDKVVVQKKNLSKRINVDNLFFKKRFAIPFLFTLILLVLCEFLSQGLKPQVGFYLELIGHTLFIVFMGQVLFIAFFTVKMCWPIKKRYIFLIIYMVLMLSLLMTFFFKDIKDLYADLPAALSQEYCIKEGYVTSITTSNEKQYRKMDITIGNDSFVIDNFYFMSSFQKGSFYRIYYLKNSRFVMNVLTRR